MPDEVVPPPQRQQRAQRMDARIGALFTEATSATADGGRGVALVAVGGYGRSELSPASDLDLVLVHTSDARSAVVGEVAERIWYPLWDDGLRLDHAVRSAAEMTAQTDVRSVLGMLDARAVAGDAGLVRTLRSHVLASWRQRARTLLPELRAAWDDRVERAGWLAYAATPDLKDSGGGLRDGVVLRALVSTWLIDIPRRDTESIRQQLLDIRDALHTVSGRRGDRLAHEQLPEVAAELGIDAADLDLRVRELGWRMAHIGQLAWRRIDGVLDVRSRGHRPIGGPRVERLADGVGVLGGEVVLTRDARPDRDGDLALRAAAAAATHDLILSPQVPVRCARTAAETATPWPKQTRELLIELLASGPELIAVWAELDIAGIIDRWLPEWSAIRLRGSSSPVHTYTIDRHSVQTVVHAAELMRRVSRPDLLVVAALLHDIGKGRPGDHSVAGEPIARRIALRWGFDASDAERIAALVRLHLLLPTAATRRDIEDPVTVQRIAATVGDSETLELLAALTEADARATGPTAWTAWRAGLVRGLVARTREWLATESPNPPPEAYAGWDDWAIPDVPETGFAFRRLEHHTGALFAVTAPDRPGLMADIAAAFAFARAPVRSARVTGGDGVAATLWEVADVDPARVETLLRRVADGGVDLSRLSYRRHPTRPRPVVTVLPGRSVTSSVIEVRADDARGLLWTCCRVIAGHGHQIRSAHITTIGPQADNVFYLLDADGVPLTDDALGALVEALDAALSAA